uniref:EGF_CA domain-containing protein n=1 Tax=Globodera pallida TaxID=36090 RepID=A0A183BI60_GLOPA
MLFSRCKILQRCNLHESGCGCFFAYKVDVCSWGLTVTNLVCKCPHGAKGEDFSNENFEILPIPTSNVLTCKKGAFDSEENGGTRNEECYDDDKYCYIASCAKGNELVRTEWDCSPDSDCTAISAIASESVVKCSPYVLFCGGCICVLHLAVRASLLGLLAKIKV